MCFIKNLKIIIVLVVAGAISYFVIMQLSTNGLMDEIRDAFYCKDYYAYASGFDPISYPNVYGDPNVHYVVLPDDQYGRDIYSHFNMTNTVKYAKQLENSSIELYDLHRIIALHDFRDGVLYLAYSVQLNDKYGDVIYSGSCSCVKLRNR